MTSDNCRKEVKTKAYMDKERQYLFPFMTSAMDDAVIEEKPPHETRPSSSYRPTIESLVRDWNIHEALKAVKRNKGASGIDGMEVEQLEEFFATEWPAVKQKILRGHYHPQAVRRVEIPKPDGKGIRKLGIPTVVDRMIQQAILQEISLAFEPTFS